MNLVRLVDSWSGRSKACGAQILWVCFFGLSAVLWSAQASAGVDVQHLSLFVADASLATEDRRLPATGHAESTVNGLAVTFTERPAPDGAQEWLWELVNTGDQLRSNLRLTAYVDPDIAAAENTFFNETARLIALDAPAGHIAPDRWEISEPGYWSGDLLPRALTGALKNHVAPEVEVGDDVAMALSLLVEELQPGQKLTVIARLGGEPSTGLTHVDAHGGVHTAFQFRGYLEALNQDDEEGGDGSDGDGSDGDGSDGDGPDGDGPDGEDGAEDEEGDSDFPGSDDTADEDEESGEGDSCPDESSCEVDTDIRADLLIVKTTSTPFVQQGAAVEYQIVANNLGPDAQSDVYLRDLVPDALESVTWTCQAEGGAVCGQIGGSGHDIDLALPLLPVGGEVTLAVTATAVRPGNIVNTAHIGALTGNDPDPDNNTNSAEVDIVMSIHPIPMASPETLILLVGLVLGIAVLMRQKKSFSIFLISLILFPSVSGEIYASDGAGHVNLPASLFGPGECVSDLQVRSKPGVIQLTWSDIGASSYKIYRSNNPLGPFFLLSETRSTYSTWLDRKVRNGQTYFYSLSPVYMDGKELCAENIEGQAPDLISSINRPPSIVSRPLSTILEKRLFDYDVLAHDPDMGDVLSYTLSTAPSGAGITDVNIDWYAGRATQSLRSRNHMCRFPGSVPLHANASNPLLKWHRNQSRMSLSVPLLGPFFDTNGDGKYDENDRPTIAHVELGVGGIDSGTGTLRFLNGQTGQVLASLEGIPFRASATPGFADIDGDGRPEIIGYLRDGRIVAVRPTGEVIWTTSESLNHDGMYNYGAINISDIDGDGTPEILAREYVLNADGSIRWDIAGRGVRLWHVVTTYAVDLNGDGRQEVVMGGSVFDSNGLFLWGSGYENARSVVADLDGDGNIEVIFSSGGRLHFFSSDGLKLRESQSFHGGGMAPVAADFDGDGLPEIGVPGPVSFNMIDGDGRIMWSVPMSDRSAIGASAFDFDGDGRAEVIFVDHSMLRIVDGLTGAIIYSEPNGSATTSEYSYAADIDADGHAELLVVSNLGLRAFEAPNGNWAAARKLWNQYDYHVDNINDNTSVPRRPAKGWLSHNSFRQNAVPNGGADALPDLAVYDLVLDDLAGLINVTVVNRGMAPASDFKIHLYSGLNAQGVKLSEISMEGLEAGESRVVTFSLSSVEALVEGATALIVPGPEVQECNVGNNSASAFLFAVKAEDREGLHDTQHFLLSVDALNHAPVILSSSLPGALEQQEYRTLVHAMDSDQGDALRFELLSAIDGMYIDAVSGELVWTGPEEGGHTVAVRVYDLAGLSNEKTFLLDVGKVLPGNHAPEIKSEPETWSQEGVFYRYHIEASDPDGDFLEYTLVQGPAEASLNAVTGAFTWERPKSGLHLIRIAVSDGKVQVEQSFTLQVTTEPLAGFAFSLEVEPRHALFGQQVALQAIPISGTPPYSVVQFQVNGHDLVPDSSFRLTYIPSAVGEHPFRVVLRDSQNQIFTQETSFWVTDGEASAPQIRIIFPGESDEISVATISTLTDVIGDAQGTSLGGYRLLLSPAGLAQWHEISSGTDKVTDGKLGSLNPQTLANGLYDLRLEATSVNGVQSAAQIAVAIEGQQKTAPLQLTFEDLSFDIEGLPLTVRRSYDSLKRLQSFDFGYGWTVDYQDVWLQTNGPLGRQWQTYETGSLLGARVCAQPVGMRTVTLRLPGGALEQFDLRAQPECMSRIQWLANPNIGIVFTPKAGNQSGSTLRALGHGDLRIAGGELFDLGNTRLFDPDQFLLTQRDGTEYTLDKHFGIEQIRDRHGNTLQFSANGIHHSGGWALQFTRDAHGRITRIDAPGNKTLSYGYDGAGNLISMTDEIGAVSTYAYNAPSVPHGLTDYTDPLGRLLLKTEYDAEGRVTRQTDGAGRAVTIATDNSANRQTVRDRNGNTTVYTFDERGNVTQVTDALGGITRYAYDAHDNEISVTDPLGRTTTRSFDAYGNITSETDPLGRITTTAYNARGNVTEVTDAAGNVTRNSWSPNNELTRITNPLGQATDLGYTPRGSLLSLTDAAGNQTRYSYAAINGTQLKQSETGPDGTVSTYSYDAAGNVTATGSSLVLSEGGSPVTVTTRSTWDAKGRLISQTDAGGHTTSYQYNAAGELTQETDALGRVTHHSYTVRGEKSETLYPDGLKDTWQYDHNGNETRSCSGNGNLCTNTQYDALDRPTQVTDPAGYITHTRYDAAGQVTETTDGRGNTTGYEYDDGGRQTRLTNPLNHASTSAYDLAGNLVEETDPLGHTIEHSYNAANQRTGTTLPTGAITAWGYNAVGQRTTETTPEGHVTTFAYDLLGRLASVTDPLAHSTGYQYNQQGQLLSQTDAEGRTTHYGYDSAGRRVRRTLADGTSEALSYNAVGQLIQKTGFDAATTIWEYGSTGSDTGRLLRIHRPDGSNQRVTYDSYGRPTGHTDSRDGTEHLNLDTLGRITQRSLNHSAAQLPDSAAYGYTTHYQWDANSNRTRLRVTNPNRDINASYDAANQLHTLDSIEGAQAVFTHDAAGRLAHIVRSDGSTSSYTYNAAGQLTGVHHQAAGGTTLARFTYTLNLNGQRTAATEEINAGADSTRRTLAWQYDAAGKLTQEQIAQTQPTVQTITIDYQYDRAGNRTTKTVSGSQTQSTTYTYDANDRLTQEVDSLHGTTTYAYDFKGQLVGKTHAGQVTTYTWNTDHRLTKVESGTRTIRYGYDPQGRRIKKLVTEGANKTETHYILDTERAYHEVVIERTRHNTGPWQERTYLHTPGGVGELISDSDGTTTRQVYTDGQGSTRLTVDGTDTHSWSYDAFGNLQAGSSAQPTHGYTGERYDPDTGLIHLRARDYDPGTGRFISMDEHPGSQRIPLTLNKYLYANADPVNHIDPSGYITMGSLGAGLNIQGILNAAGLASRMLHLYARVNNVVDLTIALIQLAQMDPSTILEGVSPRQFPPRIDFSDAAQQFMIGSRKAITIGLSNWSAGYVKEYMRGKRLKSYIVYLPVISPAAPRLIDTKRKISGKPLKVGIGAPGRNTRGSLAGVGVEMGHQRMLYRMDIGLTPAGHRTGKGYELDTFDMPPNYSFHVYKFIGGPR